MEIKWLADVKLEIVTNVGSTAFTVEQETVFCGSENTIDILEDKGDIVDMQFWNGSCVYGVKKEWFKVIK